MNLQKSKLPYVFLTLTSIPLQATAAGMTGNQLRMMCDQPANSVGDAGCNAYIRGFHEGLISMKYMTDAEIYCPPSDATVGKLRSVVVTWLKANNDGLGADIALGTATSLISAFPCNARK